MCSYTCHAEPNALFSTLVLVYVDERVEPKPSMAAIEK